MEEHPELSQQQRIALAKAALVKAQLQPEPVRPRTREQFQYRLPFPAPNYAPDPKPTTLDLVRKVVVTVTALAFAIMAGLTFGPRSATAADSFEGGFLHSEYAMLSFLSETHLMWLILVIAVIIHATFVWWPTQTSTPRQQRTGFLMAGIHISGILWFVAAANGIPWLLLVASAAGSLCGIQAVRELNIRTARYNWERIATDGVIGLLTGWFIALTGNAVSILLTHWGWDLWIPEDIWALVGIAAVTWVGAYLCMTERGRISIAFGIAVGFVGIMIARLFGDHHSIWVAIVSGCCAFVLLLVTENRRYRIRHAENRAARGLATEFD